MRSPESSARTLPASRPRPRPQQGCVRQENGQTNGTGAPKGSSAPPKGSESPSICHARKRQRRIQLSKGAEAPAASQVVISGMSVQYRHRSRVACAPERVPVVVLHNQSASTPFMRKAKAAHKALTLLARALPGHDLTISPNIPASYAQHSPAFLHLMLSTSTSLSDVDTSGPELCTVSTHS